MFTLLILMEIKLKLEQHLKLKSMKDYWNKEHYFLFL